MRKKFFVSLALFLFVLNILVWQEVFVLSQPKYLKVNFLSVEQGDSEFIETPEGHQILIDGGPGSAILEKLNFLMPFWDKTLDLVILTHPEKDHMQGLLEVLKSYKADYILWTGVKKTAPEYNEWILTLENQKKMGAQIIIADPGKKIILGSVEIDDIYPFENLNGKEFKNTSNDSCIVSRLIYGANSFLFAGDIDSAAEKEIIEKENVKSDILKVAHHGSKYSTSDLFLQNIMPKLATIEVGKNSYGHPTQEVLNRLANFGIKVLRTDKNGDIKFLSDGINIKIEN